MWDPIKEFVIAFNQGVGLITLVVGLLAIYLYLKQRKDNKRQVASLILQEIRYAEQKIRDHRKFKAYKFYDTLLPTNNWYVNINLFVKDLKETEIDLISRFYSQAVYVDSLIKHLANLAANKIPNNVAVPLSQLNVGGSTPPPTAPMPIGQPIIIEFDPQARLLLILSLKKLSLFITLQLLIELDKLLIKNGIIYYKFMSLVITLFVREGIVLEAIVALP